jgi:hypothetical protein
LDAAALQVGQIVLARIPDPDGAPLNEPHPALLFRGPDARGTVYLIGITSSFHTVGRGMIEVDWHPQGIPSQASGSRAC